MTNYTFTLPKGAAKKGMQQVGGKYNFKNGAMTVTEDLARKIKPILTRFYGCSVAQTVQTNDEVKAEAKAAENEEDAVLSKTATKASK